jgi:hypothetical protein
MNMIEFYISIRIIKYKSFEKIIELLNLIDEKVIWEKTIDEKVIGENNKNIFNTNYSIEWTRTIGTEYDYRCILITSDPIEFDMEKMNNYIKAKFNLIQNDIKFNYDYFGSDWTINFIINK